MVESNPYDDEEPDADPYHMPLDSDDEADLRLTVTQEEDLHGGEENDPRRSVQFAAGSKHAGTAPSKRPEGTAPSERQPGSAPL